MSVYDHSGRSKWVLTGNLVGFSFASGLVASVMVASASVGPVVVVVVGSSPDRAAA